MKNKEMYAKEIIEIVCDGRILGVNKVTGKPTVCGNISCEECLRYDGRNTCAGEVLREWAESEYIEKQVISKRDRAFLDYLRENAKWMTRESGSGISVWLTKPKKDKSISAWTDGMYNCLSELNIDFPMVKWEDDKPWLIEDLKKLEVVDSYE